MALKRPCPDPECDELLHPKSVWKHMRRKHSQPPLAAPTTTTNVLFITIPDGKDITNSHADTIRASFFADESTAQLLGGTTGLNQLKKSLGQSLVANYKAIWYIHQLLATILIARERYDTKWELQLQNWDWAIPLIRSGTLLDSLQNRAENSQTVLFVSSTSANWPQMSQTDFLDALHPMVAGYSHIRVFPSISEQRFEMLKIADIRTLDTIATAANCPNEFSFRPTTCYGYGKCALSQLEPEDYHVLKRSKSCASSHVMLKKSTDRGELQCNLPNNSLGTNTTRRDPASPLWFHQEFVPELDEFEFRVFIKKNMAGDGGKVVHTILTTSPPLEKGVPGAGNTLRAQISCMDDFSWAVQGAVSRTKAIQIQEAKMQELKAFALYKYDALCKVPDAKLHYETLEVGVRLDIGVLDKSHFFVNEITRLPEADWFSEATIEIPHLRLSEEFAEPLAKYLAKAI